MIKKKKIKMQSITMCFCTFTSPYCHMFTMDYYDFTRNDTGKFLVK